jgi:hypothetical protein
LSLALPAFASVQQEWTGRTLRDLFAARERIEVGRPEDGDATRVGILIGYGAAWSESLGVDGMACFPKRATLEQAIAHIARYLADHPDQLTDPAFVLVGRAWREAYPCKSR